MGPLNFVNSGTINYADVVAMLDEVGINDWEKPTLRESTGQKSAPCLSVKHFEDVVGKQVTNAAVDQYFLSKLLQLFIQKQILLSFSNFQMFL